MIRLLLISYYWPPLGGPGAIRPVKFAKYLPRFGFEPVILTRKAVAYHSFDANLGGELKGIRVVRTESLDPARICYLAGMRKYSPRPWQVPIKKALNFPDSKFPWIPFAYAAAMHTDFDCIFVTAPPFSSFITGYLLAKKTGKPLVADFRDAWLEFPFMRYDTAVEKKFVSHWEWKIARAASLITVVDENIRDSMVRKYPELGPRIHVIPNGYDPDDFPAAAPPRVFTVSYLGTVRKERDPGPFLEAVEELIREEKLSAAGIQVKFIGHIEESYLNSIKKYGFTRCLGHLHYPDALREFSTAHAALMVTTGDEYFFPSRQHEYLATGLPVIVCGRSGGLHRLASAFSRGYPGWIVDHGDIKAIKEKILTLNARFRQGDTARYPTPFKDSTRENLTRTLSVLMKKACSEKEP